MKWKKILTFDEILFLECNPLFFVFLLIDAIRTDTIDSTCPEECYVERASKISEINKLFFKPEIEKIYAFLCLKISDLILSIWYFQTRKLE